MAARMVIIGGAAQNGTIHYDDVNLTNRFNVLRVVSQFCEANDVFVIELARRLAQSAEKRFITVNTLKVGVVRTNIRQQFPLWMKIIVPLIADPLLGQTPQRIADSAMCLLTAPEYEGQTGGLYSHITRFKPVTPGQKTSSTEEGKRLWDLSERLVAKASAHTAPHLSLA